MFLDRKETTSLSRKTYYETQSGRGHCIPVNNENVELDVPEYIMEKLKLMK